MKNGIEQTTKIATPSSGDLNRSEDSDLSGRLNRAIDSALTQNRVVGTVVSRRSRRNVVFSRTARFADRENGQTMHEQTIFRLGSAYTRFR
jgi:CubicO group peptidase (beta-lactamase class C family)